MHGLSQVAFPCRANAQEGGDGGSVAAQHPLWARGRHDHAHLHHGHGLCCHLSNHPALCPRILHHHLVSHPSPITRVCMWLVSAHSSYITWIQQDCAHLHHGHGLCGHHPTHPPLRPCLLDPGLGSDPPSAYDWFHVHLSQGELQYPMLHP